VGVGVNRKRKSRKGGKHRGTERKGKFAGNISKKARIYHRIHG
jgi:hypothetical protein